MIIFMAGRVSHFANEKRFFPHYDRRLISWYYKADLPAYIRVVEYYETSFQKKNAGRRDT